MIKRKIFAYLGESNVSASDRSDMRKEVVLAVILSRESLVLVPLGLPFFIPFALSNRTGLSFWPTFAIGLMLASISIGMWFRFGPNPPAIPPNNGSSQTEVR